MYDASKRIDEFLNATAARTPTPGGGSVSALVGALATSLGEMVLNYSLNKKGLEAYAEEFRPALAELTRARQVLLELVVEDQAAYQALVAAKRLPAGSPERKATMDAALLVAIRVPESIAATGVCVLERCDRLVSMVSYHLLGDMAVCADLAMASIRCAIYNVRVNSQLVEDPEDRRRFEATVGQILTRALSLIQSTAPRIWERNAHGV